MTEIDFSRTCIKCAETFPLEGNFSKRKNRPEGSYSTICKFCVREKSKKWYSENKDRHYLSGKLNRELNREAYNEKRRENRRKQAALTEKIHKEPFDKKKWVRENKDKVAAAKRRYLQKNKKAALADSYRRRLNYALRRVNSGKKLRNSNSILGCTWEELQLHIERQFLKGMNWENRSEWHIDHIIPLASAETEEGVYALNHFTNLRPMWSHENMKKSASVLYLL